MSLSMCFSIFARSSSPYEPRGLVTFSGGFPWYRLTILPLSFEVHSRGQNAFRTNCSLNFELILGWGFLYELRLKYEPGVFTVCCYRETRNFLLSPE